MRRQKQGKKNKPNQTNDVDKFHFYCSVWQYAGDRLCSRAVIIVIWAPSYSECGRETTNKFWWQTLSPSASQWWPPSVWVWVTSGCKWEMKSMSNKSNGKSKSSFRFWVNEKRLRYFLSACGHSVYVREWVRKFRKELIGIAACVS